MRIMTAMYTMKRGGSYDRFIMMLEAFLERGCEVYCLSLKPIQIENPWFRNHILVYPFRSKENLIAKLVVFFFFPLWSVWVGWRHKIDLIIAFGSLYGFLLSFSKWLLQKPMVTLIRGNFSFGLRTQNSSTVLVFLNKMIEYYGLLFSDKIITNNSAARDEILKRFGKKRNIEVQVLYNNIPPMNIREPEDDARTKDKYGIPGNAKVLVTAGILNQGKNIEMLINCLPDIGIKNLYLLVAGDGSTRADLHYKDFLQRLVEELELSKRVVFTGWLEKEELWKIYLASNLFVLPSLSEGMPNAMLEALGFNLPCLGSRVSGVKDVLQYEDLMFDALDREDLVEKVRHFFSDELCSNYVMELCQARKKEFIFDWEEKSFQMVTNSIFDRGESNQA